MMKTKLCQSDDYKYVKFSGRCFKGTVFEGGGSGNLFVWGLKFGNAYEFVFESESGTLKHKLQDIKKLIRKKEKEIAALTETLEELSGWDYDKQLGKRTKT